MEEANAVSPGIRCRKKPLRNPRLLLEPNATWWNTLFNSKKFINDVSKAKLNATCSTLSLPKLQHEELFFVDEYRKVCYKYFLRFAQCTEFENYFLDNVCSGKGTVYFCKESSICTWTFCSLLSIHSCITSNPSNKRSTALLSPVSLTLQSREGE